MKNPDGTPNTAHTTNPVPIILVERKKKIINGILANVTILIYWKSWELKDQVKWIKNLLLSN